MLGRELCLSCCASLAASSWVAPLSRAGQGSTHPLLRSLPSFSFLPFLSLSRMLSSIPSEKLRDITDKNNVFLNYEMLTL